MKKSEKLKPRIKIKFKYFVLAHMLTLFFVLVPIASAEGNFFDFSPENAYSEPFSKLIEFLNGKKNELEKNIAKGSDFPKTEKTRSQNRKPESNDNHVQRYLETISAEFLPSLSAGPAVSSLMSAVSESVKEIAVNKPRQYIETFFCAAKDFVFPGACRNKLEFQKELPAGSVPPASENSSEKMTAIKQQYEEAINEASALSQKFNLLQNEMEKIKAGGVIVRQPVIEQRVVERTVEKIVSGLSQGDLDSGLANLKTELNNLNTSLTNQINTMSANSNRQTSAVYQAVSLTNRIDSLSGTRLTNIIVSGVSGLTDSDIPDGITASNYLPLIGGTISGDLTVAGNATLGVITLQNATAGYFTATSTAQASTFHYASSTALTVSGAAYIGSLNGPLQANNGLVSATTSVGTVYGGTGINSSALTGVAQIVSGTWSASSTLSTAFGGTGWGNLQANAVLLGNGAGRLATTSAGTDGYVLALSAGAPTWTATSTLSTIAGTLSVAKGGTGQTSFGQGWLNSDGTTLSASTSPTVNYFTATSTTASTFPYASTTAITVSGNSYFGTVSSGLWNGTAIATQYGGTGQNFSASSGLVNLYSGTASAIATSSLGLLTTDVAEGTNLYWTNTRFDNRLSATTSLQNLTTLANLATVGTITSGTWNGTTIAVNKGGTGLTSYTLGDVLYASGTGTLAGTSTANLKSTLALNNVENTALSAWAGTTNITTLGTIGTGVWNGTTIAVNKGGTGQTSFGQGWLNSDGTTLSASTSPTVNYITATSTTASTFPYASTTAFTASGTGYFGAISNTGGYTQSGTSANTFTGTPTFSNATYSALFTGGNVGIGTASPGYKLDVAGDMNISAGSILRYNGAIFSQASTTLNNYFTGGAGNLTMTGTYNTANGYAALFSNTTGFYNTANGMNSLFSNTTGTYNTANGYAALSSNTTGTYNTANGYAALSSNTTGYYNTANGLNSLFSNTTGTYNTANGMNSLFSNTTGYRNTANGTQALFSNTTGFYNTANGYAALFSNTTGYYNTANGLNSLLSNTTGYENIANGLDAGRYITDGSTANQTSNTSLYLGNETKALADGDSNEIVIGYNATGVGSNSAVLGNDSITKTILKGNVGIGTTTPTTKLNVAGGVQVSGTGYPTAGAGLEMSGGVAPYIQAYNRDTPAYLPFNIYGSTFAFNPSVSGVFHITNDGNVGIGTASPNNKLDIYSTTKSAIGFSGASGDTYKWTMGMNVSNGGIFSIASSTALGTTDRLVIDGNGKVGIGTAAPTQELQVGSNSGSMALGDGLTTNGTSRLFFTSSNSVTNWKISSNDVVSAALEFTPSSTAGGKTFTTPAVVIEGNGNVGIGTTSPWRTLSVTGTVGFSGSLSATTTNAYDLCIDALTFEVTKRTTDCSGASSLRYKQNIEKLSYGLDDLMKLNPVSFQYTEAFAPTDRARKIGFIAEEVALVIPEVVAYDDMGRPDSLDYSKITSLLAKSIQELNLKVIDLQASAASSSGTGTDGLFAWIVNKFMTAFGIVFEKDTIKAKNICVGETCVTEEQFKMVFGSSQSSSSLSSSSSSSSTESSSSSSSSSISSSSSSSSAASSESSNSSESVSSSSSSTESSSSSSSSSISSSSSSSSAASSESSNSSESVSSSSSSTESSSSSLPAESSSSSEAVSSSSSSSAASSESSS